jgi:hypothetical protein
MSAWRQRNGKSAPQVCSYLADNRPVAKADGFATLCR